MSEDEGGITADRLNEIAEAFGVFLDRVIDTVTETLEQARAAATDPEFDAITDGVEDEAVYFARLGGDGHDIHLIGADGLPLCADHIGTVSHGRWDELAHVHGIESVDLATWKADGRRQCGRDSATGALGKQGCLPEFLGLRA